MIIDCLNSLEAGVSDLNTEIIVVDNQSEDGTPDQLRHIFPHIRLIVNEHNLGFASANNQGIAAASGDYILLLNPDVIVGPAACSIMVSFLKQNPRVGIIGPRTFDPAGYIVLTAHPPYTPWLVLWQYLGLDSLFPYQFYGQYRRACEQSANAFEVAWVQAHCLMMTCEVAAQTGGMDDGVFLFTEDPDLCERAWAAGYRVMYVPKAQVEHHESTTVSRYPLVKMRHYHISPLHYFRKRSQTFAVGLLKVGFSFELIVKFCLRLIELEWLRKTHLRERLWAYGIVLGEVWRY